MYAAFDFKSNADSFATILRRLFRFPRGPDGFGSATTAYTVAQRYAGVLRGNIALVTGPSVGGIGYTTALELARVGVTVVLAGRSRAKLAEAAAAIRKEVPAAALEELLIDLQSLASVRAAAETYLTRHDSLNLLINNAGIMGVPFQTSPDGWESQFAGCHLGHFALTELLTPALRTAAARGGLARIVNVSSMGHRAVVPWVANPPEVFNPQLVRDTPEARAVYSPWNGYGRAKISNVIHARLIAQRERRRGTGVTATSLMPGGIPTHLSDHISGVSIFLRLVRLVFLLFHPPGLKDYQQGAATTIYCAASPDAARNSGSYYEDCVRNPNVHPIALDESAGRALWQVSVAATRLGDGDGDPFA